MCELLAVNCSVPSSVTFSFQGFCARGGRTGEHGDGFGLAFYSGPACRLFVDEGRASDSPLAAFLCRHPLRANTVLGHIRKATQGPVELANCHPFVREWQGRHWAFCHNGDLRHFHPDLQGRFRPVGTTDSERAFCWILQELACRFAGEAAPGWPVVAQALAALTPAIARHGTFNFLLSDGQALYAHGASRLFWVARRHPFPTVHLVDSDLSLDLATVNGPQDRMIVIATAPLTRNEDWLPFEAGQLRVFVDGEPVWEHATAEHAAQRAAVAA